MVSTYKSSTGHVLSQGEWLDAHFTACRAEYERLFAQVPFLAGTVVLDAGCGNGAFLPLLQQAVTAHGRVIAADIARENLCGLGGAVTSDVRHLPLLDSCLDGIWSANVAQYLDDRNLERALAEFRRVLRPGGLVALKDVDMRAWDVQPAPPFLGAHLAEACVASGTAQSAGSLRARRLKLILESAGFRNVEQHSLVIERWAPLDSASRRFWSQWLLYLAEAAADVDLPADERGFWQGLSSPEAARAFVDAPGFYGCELQAVAFGYHPGDAGA